MACVSLCLLLQSPFRKKGFVSPLLGVLSSASRPLSAPSGTSSAEESCLAQDLAPSWRGMSWWLTDGRVWGQALSPRWDSSEGLALVPELPMAGGGQLGLWAATGVDCSPPAPRQFQVRRRLLVRSNFLEEGFDKHSSWGWNASAAAAGWWRLWVGCQHCLQEQTTAH